MWRFLLALFILVQLCHVQALSFGNTLILGKWDWSKVEFEIVMPEHSCVCPLVSQEYFGSNHSKYAQEEEWCDFLADMKAGSAFPALSVPRGTRIEYRFENKPFSIKDLDDCFEPFPYAPPLDVYVVDTGIDINRHWFDDHEWGSFLPRNKTPCTRVLCEDDDDIELPFPITGGLIRPEDIHDNYAYPPPLNFWDVDKLLREYERDERHRQMAGTLEDLREQEEQQQQHYDDDDEGEQEEM